MSATTELDLKALNKFSRQNAALGRSIYILYHIMLHYIQHIQLSYITHLSYFVGAETTAKLIKMKLLISGLRGLGMETAKNLALQGAGAITVRREQLNL